MTTVTITLSPLAYLELRAALAGAGYENTLWEPYQDGTERWAVPVIFEPNINPQGREALDLLLSQGGWTDMNALANILKYVQLALAGVAIVEQTSAAETPGTTKQKTAIDIINNEAQLVGVAFPNQAQLAGSIVNLAVAAFNIAGLFQHKKTPPTTGS